MVSHLGTYLPTFIQNYPVPIQQKDQVEEKPTNASSINSTWMDQEGWIDDPQENDRPASNKYLSEV
jgi:hypothetical protein